MYCTIAAPLHRGYKSFVKLFKYTWIVFCAALSAPVFAGTADGYEKITGEALRKVYSETLFIAEYMDYRDKTKTYNYTEYHNTDGTTDYKEGARRETGRWKIIGEDKICYQYPEGDDPNDKYCFFTYKHGKCYYQFHHTEMTIRGPRNVKIWNSRGVRAGDGGSCNAAIG